MKNQKVLITGSSGFIGKHIFNDNRSDGFHFLSRKHENIENWHQTNDFLGESSYPVLDNNYDVVVYLSSSAHSKVRDVSKVYEINYNSLLNFAKKATETGVKRFIYLNTVSIFGNLSQINSETLPKPADYISQIRYVAEQELFKLSKLSNMEVVSIRSPLVYGKGAPANFGKLIRLSQSGFPLPFGSLSNKISLINIYNLVDFIFHCIQHPLAKNRAFLVSDDNEINFNELIKELKRAAGRRALMFPIPINFLKVISMVAGKGGVINKLTKSQVIDITDTREVLNWQPPLTMSEGIELCFN